MQQPTCKMVWFFSFFSLKKALILRKSSGKNSESVEKCGKMWRSVEKCEKVPIRTETKERSLHSLSLSLESSRVESVSPWLKSPCSPHSGQSQGS